MRQIIHDDKVFGITILNNSQIFNEKTILGLHTIHSGEYPVDEFPTGIDVVDNGVRIIRTWRREDKDVIIICQDLEEISAEGANIDP